jgi:hypothetical protein
MVEIKIRVKNVSGNSNLHFGDIYTEKYFILFSMPDSFIVLSYSSEFILTFNL